jgi:hypothetical protein
MRQAIEKEWKISAKERAKSDMGKSVRECFFDEIMSKHKKNFEFLYTNSTEIYIFTLKLDSVFFKKKRFCDWRNVIS